MYRTKLSTLLMISNILILSLLLIGCGNLQRRNNIPQLNLPTMPLLNDDVINEFKKVCVPQNRCDNINNWLNELYIFNVKYDVYRLDLSK